MNTKLTSGEIAGMKSCSKVIGRILCIVLTMVLTACTEELYTGLSEKEGNEMLSILLEEGIDAKKIPQPKGKLVTLVVNGSELSKAIRVLKSRGYPRDDFASVGDLFKKDGLISSPLEERARYIYGLSQEISATLSQLDGVITARVHVVMPEVKDKKAPLKVSSASVFIKHAQSVKMEDFVPQIKMLVNNGIEGLSYGNISVALFPAQTATHPSTQAMETLFSIQVDSQSAKRLHGLLWTLLLLLLCALGGNLFFYTRMRTKTTALVADR
jgi:type III secretion protein J